MRRARQPLQNAPGPSPYYPGLVLVSDLSVVIDGHPMVMDNRRRSLVAMGGTRMKKMAMIIHGIHGWKHDAIIMIILYRLMMVRTDLDLHCSMAPPPLA